MIDFIVATNNREVLKNNLLRSLIIQQYGTQELMGFKNIPEAYNIATPSAPDGVVCYVHQDVFLPDTFAEELAKGIALLPDDWGVVGVAGVKLVDGVKKNYGYISDRGNLWGKPFRDPVEVQTLDELLLITKGNYKFDENLPFDFYGADICMQAQAQGKKCYAINAFVEHNSTRPVGGRTPEFYTAEQYFRDKWKDLLPIVTTCSRLEKM